MKTKLAIAVALTLVCGAAWSADSGFYVGAGVGWSDVSANVKYTEKDFNGDKYTDSTKFSGSDVAYSFFVGYDFNKYAAVELGYLDLGKPSDQYRNDLGEGVTGKDNVDIKLNGIDLVVIGKYPFADNFDVHARLGVIFWSPEVTDRFTVSDSTGVLAKATYTEKADSTDLLVGAGASYTWNEHFVLSFDWLHAEVGGLTGAIASDTCYQDFCPEPVIDNTDAWMFSGAWKF